MSVNNKFVLYQVKREIRRNGTEFKFFRTEKNEFGEPMNEATEVASITGLYYAHAPHILDAYIVLTGAQAASTRTKKFPVLLCPWEDLFEPVEAEVPENPDEDIWPFPEEPGGTGEGDVGPEVENETDGAGTEDPTPEVPPTEEPAPEEPDEPVEVPKRCKIQIGDYVMINGHLTHVTGVYNVMEWDLVCHISFEEIDYGGQSLLPGGQKPDKSPLEEDGCQQSYHSC